MIKYLTVIFVLSLGMWGQANQQVPGTGGRVDFPPLSYHYHPPTTPISLPDSIPTDESVPHRDVHSNNIVILGSDFGSRISFRGGAVSVETSNSCEGGWCGSVGYTGSAIHAIGHFADILEPLMVMQMTSGGGGKLPGVGGPNGGIPEPPGGESAWKSAVGEAMAKIDTLRGKTRADLGVARVAGQEGEMWLDLNGNHFIDTLMDQAMSHGPNSDAAGKVLVDFVDSNGARTIEQVISGNDQMADFFRGKYASSGNPKWILGIDVPMRPVNGVTPGLRYNRFPKTFGR